MPRLWTLRVMLLVLLTGLAGAGAEQKSFDYILWDGHRFARTEEQHERDFRYYRDLGFTHTFLGNANETQPRNEERARWMLGAADKYDMFVGYRYHFHSDVDDLARLMGLTREQMIKEGMLLAKRAKSPHYPYNPIHPKIIQHYRDGFIETLDFNLKFDTGRRIRLFLIGTERVFTLPKRAQDAYPRALEIVMAAAREDGVEAKDISELGAWWSGAHRKGERWRLQKAFEDAVLERIPQADFMVDPIWAVKIVHGFGGDWAYIGNDPKNIAASVKRLQAVTRPDPAAHSTQLIRGASHDKLLTANLLAICMGVDKLYHWGINTVEPGRYLNPGYGSKTLKPTPQGYPEFRERHVRDWDGFMKALIEKGKRGAGKQLWAALPEKLRREIENATLLMADAPVSGRMKDEVVKALNAALAKEGLFDGTALKGMKLPHRVAELAGRIRKDEDSAEDLKELNRLRIEGIFPATLAQTPQPALPELRERVRHKRHEKEPAIRGTGRLLRERGAMFSEWKPAHPRLGLIGGIYSHQDLHKALIIANVPFDILRDPRDRLRSLPRYRFVGLTKPEVSDEEYDILLKITREGGKVFAPVEFQAPEGKPALTNLVEWMPHTLNRGRVKVGVDALARGAKAVARQAGLLPRVDTEQFGIVIGNFEYRGIPVAMVVNDRRNEQGAGVPADAILIVNDDRDVRVLDIDAGETVPCTRKAGFLQIKDRIEPAWYRLYAILGPGQKWPGPGPLRKPPTVQSLQAQADAKTQRVRLSWTLPFEDWAGCDVERYIIYRGVGAADPEQIAVIDARRFEGPGGLITEWSDEAAWKGAKWNYQVQTVSPLRTVGTKSASANIE